MVRCGGQRLRDGASSEVAVYTHSHPHKHMGKKGHKSHKKGRSRARQPRNRLGQFKRK